MGAEEDNFDIDIYGDGDGGEAYGGEGNYQEPQATEPQSEYPDRSVSAFDGGVSEGVGASASGQGGAETGTGSYGDRGESQPHHPPNQPQGVKRKEHDDRPTDPGATTALFVSDLAWWITDDEIRGWANQSSCEDELEEITFSEHKVNGKSKGQAYLLTSSPQAATAIKHHIDSFADSQKYKQRFSASYTNPHTNPFKTLPKDANTRSTGNSQGSRVASGSYSSGGTPSPSAGFSQTGFRGGRGGYNRGGAPNSGGFGRGGMNMSGGYQSGGVGGFQNSALGGMTGYGGFQARGGMMNNNMRGGSMGMRGGRGGVNSNMMGMPMGMPLGGMPAAMGNMNMGMPPMNGPMGMQGGYQNPGFYPPQGDSNWNPHGAKRTRQE